MPVTGAQVAQHYSQQASTLGSMIASNNQLIEDMKKADAEIAQEHEAARGDLAATYLPELSDAAFERAGRLTGFQGFQRRDPRVALAAEKKAIQAQLAKIEADERYQRRDVLVGPAGTLTQELELAKETLEPLQTECARFESLEGFLELIQVGYDTHDFKEKWWHASYWHHWSAGDRICKALQMNDFGDDVIPAYQKFADPRDVMRADVERLDKDLDAIHTMTQQHDELADRLAHLDEIYLEQAQDFLGEHLEHADLALLEQWIANEPDLQRPVQQGLRRLAGVQAKRKFVGEIAQQGIPQTNAQLQERLDKTVQKAGKFQSPKKLYARYDDSAIGDDLSAKAAALQAQNDKLRRRVDSLVLARRYDGFNLAQDPQLWWLYLLDSPPPRYAPSLYDYYSRRPGITYIVEPDYVDLGPSTGQAAAAAVMAGSLEQGTYLS